jgi:hypothetical protein
LTAALADILDRLQTFSSTLDLLCLPENALLTAIAGPFKLVPDAAKAATPGATTRAAMQIVELGGALGLLLVEMIGAPMLALPFGGATRPIPCLYDFRYVKSQAHFSRR